MRSSFVSVETRAGEPVQVGDARIAPLAQSVRLGWPGMKVGLIWSRPVAVCVQSGDGEERLMPVRDVTRLAQLVLAGCVVFSLIVSLVCRRWFR